MRFQLILAAGLGLGAILPQAAFAKDIVVAMKTKGAAGAYVFEPAMVQAAVGDRVIFKPGDPTHNAQTIPGMLPAGVAQSKGPMGKDFVLTVSKPGIYGISCLPHQSMGMVSLVKAGAGPSPNAAQAKAVRLPPLATKRMAPLLARAG